MVESFVVYNWTTSEYENPKTAATKKIEKSRLKY